MELRDEVKGQFERSHRLAKRYYDSGQAAKARAEYIKCARLLEHLAQLSPAERRSQMLERVRHFREIADGLREGTVKVYTDGVMPSDVAAAEREGATRQERAAEKARDLILVEKPNIRFDDIAGLRDVKERIKEVIVYPFTRPDEYKYYGVQPGGGILLYGPPGCGKTMLAAAAAAECEAVFINLKISDIKDMYVGESEKNIKQVFEIAKAEERAIVFFDEIDAIAGDRSGSREGHEKSLIAELLAQMSSVEAKGAPRNYLVLAATNQPWAVDLAFRRGGGRFDAVVFIPHPDAEARGKILEIVLRGRPLEESVNLSKLAQMTKGYASSEITDICREAALIPLGQTLRREGPRRAITMSDFEKAIARKRTVLGSWYAKAAREIEASGEAEMFQDLIQEAKDY